nr:protein HESO1 isoform X1 [Ipomoea batatas]
MVCRLPYVNLFFAYVNRSRRGEQPVLDSDFACVDCNRVSAEQQVEAEPIKEEPENPLGKSTKSKKVKAGLSHVRFSVLGIPIRQPELSRIGDRFPDSQSSDQIEDPFEQPVNSAMGVSSKQLARISETFKTTCNKLSSPNQDLSLHISTLRGYCPNKKFVEEKHKTLKNAKKKLNSKFTEFVEGAALHESPKDAADFSLIPEAVDDYQFGDSNEKFVFPFLPSSNKGGLPDLSFVSSGIASDIYSAGISSTYQCQNSEAKIPVETEMAIKHLRQKRRNAQTPYVEEMFTVSAPKVFEQNQS